VSSQAPELRERKIGITPFDCPVISAQFAFSYVLSGASKGAASGLILHLTCLLSIAPLYEETPSGRWVEILRVKASCLQPV
jgi:hypothetical protein